MPIVEEVGGVIVIKVKEKGVQGTAGVNGVDGADGQGVPVGGTEDQILAKASATDFDTQWIDPGGSGATEKEYTQAAHGFTDPDSILLPVYWDGTEWKAANAADPETLWDGCITEIVDVNTFKVAMAGFYPKVGHGLTVGELYYLGENPEVERAINGEFTVDSDWTKSGAVAISGGVLTATGSGQVAQKLPIPDESSCGC